MKNELVGTRHTCYVQGQCLNTRLERGQKEFDMLTMNNLKQKCIGLHRTCASKIIFTSLNPMDSAIRHVSIDFNSTLLRKTYLFSLTVGVHAQLFSEKYSTQKPVKFCNGKTIRLVEHPSRRYLFKLYKKCTSYTNEIQH